HLTLLSVIRQVLKIPTLTNNNTVNA
ncbi:hypothetical protein PanWU01x14_100170, partial [Parasponia andersonii]